MEINRRKTEAGEEVVVSGRLDAYWADHLSGALDEVIRGGADHIRLDMAAVVYMSSVGIRVLLKVYKQVQRLNGSFGVSNPSPAVRGVLELAGLEVLLAQSPVGAEQGAGAERSVRRVAHGGVELEVFDTAPGAVVDCRVIGTAAALSGGRFKSAGCSPLAIRQDIMALGLGAFGGGFDDCRERFGEFLAAGGAAAYLPTDESGMPDSSCATGAFVPELQVLYALVCEGRPACVARFEAGGTGRIGLNALADAALAVAGTDAAALVVVAESAGLIGAALRRSPAAGPFSFDMPGLRQWLSFTSERAFVRSTACVAGVVARQASGQLAAVLRPLGGGSSLLGHFHAAAFSYRPLRKGAIALEATVTGLFEGERLQGLLHLVNDDREIVGGGESELARGACWIAPIASVDGVALS